MRRKDKEISDSATINQILTKAQVCRLGLVDVDEAYIVPVNFAYEDGAIYFHSAVSGRKIDLIRRNNLVSFEMELPQEIIRHEIACEWSARYRSLMGRGKITFIHETDTKIHALDLIMRKHGASGSPAYDSAVLGRMVVLKLEIDTITGKQSGDW